MSKANVTTVVLVVLGLVAYRLLLKVLNMVSPSVAAYIS